MLTGGSEAEESPCEIASSNLFSLLGASPIRGRGFTTDEDSDKGPRAAVLSYGMWQRRFGGDESAIGRAIEINGRAYTIVGVMPAGFSHLYSSPYGNVPALWISGIALPPTNTWNDYMAVARLQPGATVEQAAAEMDPISVHIGELYPDLKGWRAQMMSLRQLASGDRRLALIVLMGAVTFVLLIACANVANLLLARGAGRAREFAVRKALGASGPRLIRQLLIESLLLSMAGGILGLLFASWGRQGLVELAPPYLLKSAPGLAEGGLELHVLAFAFAVVLATTFLFGLAPAIESARGEIPATLKDSSRTSTETRRSRGFRSLLVVSEVTLAMVLLVGAGLMIRTLAQLNRVNLGFNPANVLTLRVPLSGERYKEPQAVAEFWTRVVAGVEALPGVESASVSRGVPIVGWAGQFFTTAENPNPPAGHVPDANYIVAGPDYFRTMQIPLRLGRPFNQHDNSSAADVAIVNEELARLQWPNENPIGKRLRMGSPKSTFPFLTVVGVAGNVLSQGPDGGVHAEVYVPYRQFPWVQRPNHLVVRAAATLKAASLIHAVVEQIERVDKDQPAADIRTMEQIALIPIGQERLVMWLLGAFAALALVLSALGIYGVLSYAVTQRTREFGVRMALGAQMGDVLRLVMAGCARLVIAGIAAGIFASLALTRFLTGMLFGVRATDPLTFAVVTFVLAAASFSACYLPAKRATKVEPLVALRDE